MIKNKLNRQKRIQKKKFEYELDRKLHRSRYSDMILAKVSIPMEMPQEVKPFEFVVKDKLNLWEKLWQWVLSVFQKKGGKE